MLSIFSFAGYMQMKGFFTPMLMVVSYNNVKESSRHIRNCLRLHFDGILPGNDGFDFKNT